MRYKDKVGTDLRTVDIEIATGPEGVIAVYFRLSEKEVARTIEADEPDVFIDVDEAGHIVGVELINPLSVNLKKLLKKVAGRYKHEGLTKLPKARVEALEELIAV